MKSGPPVSCGAWHGFWYNASVLYKSALVAQASGSLGGMVASNNRGGNYLRRRAIPVNPRTDLQHAVRSNLGSLAQVYSNTLTPAQQAGWALYGSNVPIVNAVGDARQQTGISAFIRSNATRLQIGADPILDAPINFTLGITPQISVTVNASVAPGTFNIEIINGPSYGDTDQLCLFMGRPVQPSINYFSGPFRYTSAMGGPEVFPNTQLNEVPYQASTGQKVFWKCTASMADGRYSSAGYASVIIPVIPAAPGGAAAAAAAASAAKEKRVRLRPSRAKGDAQATRKNPTTP